jgi:hypothetical protein
MQRRLAFLVAAAGLVAAAFAFELRTWHGPGTWTEDPKGKILIASWLASELWLNPWLLVVSLVAMGFAIALVRRSRRMTS